MQNFQVLVFFVEIIIYLLLDNLRSCPYKECGSQSKFVLN